MSRTAAADAAPRRRSTCVERVAAQAAADRLVEHDRAVRHDGLEDRGAGAALHGREGAGGRLDLLDLRLGRGRVDDAHRHAADRLRLGAGHSARRVGSRLQGAAGAGAGARAGTDRRECGAADARRGAGRRRSAGARQSAVRRRARSAPRPAAGGDRCVSRGAGIAARRGRGGGGGARREDGAARWSGWRMGGRESEMPLLTSIFTTRRQPHEVRLRRRPTTRAVSRKEAGCGRGRGALTGEAEKR